MCDILIQNKSGPFDLTFLHDERNKCLFIYINNWSWGIQAQDIFVKNIKKCRLKYNNLGKRKHILSYDFIAGPA